MQVGPLGTGNSGLHGLLNLERIAGLVDASCVHHRGVQACAFVFLVLGLVSCGNLNDQVAGRAVVRPGRYDSFPCANIESHIKQARERRIELEQLMARSSQSAGGDFVNVIAYRSEYIETGGTLEELAKVSSDKKCAIDSKYSSQRQVY